MATKISGSKEMEIFNKNQSFQIRKVIESMDLRGPQGPKGENGINGIDGSNGSPGLPTTLTASTPARSLNSTFTPSGTKGTWVTYSVSISCDLTVGGGQTGTVELRSDTNDTPTTVRATASNSAIGTLVIGVSITNAATFQLSYLCPPGHNVQLFSTGTATISIISQSEVALE